MCIRDRGGCGEVADGMVEEAELPGLLPAAGAHRVAVGADAAPQGEDQRKGVLLSLIHISEPTRPY